MRNRRRLLKPWMLIYAGLLIALAGHGSISRDSSMTQVSPVATPDMEPVLQLESIERRSDI